MSKILGQTIVSGNNVFMVLISPGKGKDAAIAIEKTAGHGVGKNVAFLVGDTCVVGSYNLIYTGPILSITEKNVIVTKHGRKAHMKIERFVSYNWDYNAKRIADQNHETSMSI